MGRYNSLQVFDFRVYSVKIMPMFLGNLTNVKFYLVSVCRLWSYYVAWSYKEYCIFAIMWEMFFSESVALNILFAEESISDKKCSRVHVFDCSLAFGPSV